MIDIFAKERESERENCVAANVVVPRIVVVVVVVPVVVQSGIAYDNIICASRMTMSGSCKSANFGLGPLSGLICGLVWRIGTIGGYWSN
jgi:hypothetical protein